MSNVVNSACTTIRAASQLTRPPVKTIHHTDNGKIVTKALSSIIPTPFCSPWRHPIWWWKMRHWRHDIKVMNEAVDPEFSQKLRELEDDAFLKGTGN